MTHLRRHRKLARRRVPSVWKPICRTLRKTGWGPIIDSAIAAHGKLTNPLPATALFAAIAYLGHSKVAYTHESALDALRRTPRNWIDLLGVPSAQPTTRSKTTTAPTGCPRSPTTRCAARSGGMDGFVADLLWAAIPDHAKHLRHVALDGSPPPVWARQVAHADLSDVEGADWGWTARDYRIGKEVEKVLGYLMMAAALYDPTDRIITPYVVGLHLSTGNTGEPTAARAVLEQPAATSRCSTSSSPTGASPRAPTCTPRCRSVAATSSRASPRTSRRATATSARRTESGSVGR
jgi:hypothetical protein